MKRCINCVLPETFPGIKFDEDGVCNFCRNFRGAKNLEERKLRYRQRFEKLIKEHKGRVAYDAIMSYSGGKDSTYVLSILKERYRLNVFAVTFDNGFIPDGYWSDEKEEKFGKSFRELAGKMADNAIEEFNEWEKDGRPE